MAAKNWFVPALVFSAVIAAGLGHVATRVWDKRIIEKLTTARDTALDCRRSGATAAPCPVIYRNTRIEWRDRTLTVQTPDPRQAARIAALSTQLTHARHTIRNLQRQQMRQQVAAVYGWQNGTMQHPYNTDDHCPPGSVVMYDSRLSLVSTARRRSGDPNVCYVRTSLHRLALLTPRH